MGLLNAPATFQTLMDSILRDVIDKFVVIYLDDLLKISETKEVHMKQINVILSRLKMNELYDSLKTCLFLQYEVGILGLLVG